MSGFTHLLNQQAGAPLITLPKSLDGPSFAYFPKGEKARTSSSFGPNLNFSRRQIANALIERYWYRQVGFWEVTVISRVMGNS